MNEEIARAFVRILPDTSEFRPTLKAKLAAAMRDERGSVQITADTFRAQTQLELVQRQLNRIDGRDARARVSLSGLDSFSNRLGLITSSILGLGPALIPLVAVLTAVTGGLGGALAAAGAGIGALGVVAVPAITNLVKKKKELADAEKAVAEARARQNDQAAASSASRQLAVDQARLSVSRAQASVDTAKTYSARNAATLRLRSAEISLQRAQAGSTSGSTALAAAQRHLHQVLDSMTPAERRAARGLDDFQSAFAKFRQKFEPQVFKLLAGGLDLVVAGLPLLEPLIRGAASALQTLETDAGKALRSPFWKQFLAFLGRNTEQSIVVFGRAFGNLAHGFAGMLEALQPLTGAVEGGLLTVTEKFARWGETLGSSTGFQSFLRYVHDNGPVVADFLTSMGRALQAIVIAAAPLGPIVLVTLTGLADALVKVGEVDSGKLLTVALAIGAIGLAVDSIGAIPAIILGAVAAIAYFSETSKSFRIDMLKTFLAVGPFFKADADIMLVWIKAMIGWWRILLDTEKVWALGTITALKIGLGPFAAAAGIFNKIRGALHLPKIPGLSGLADVLGGLDSAEGKLNNFFDGADKTLDGWSNKVDETKHRVDRSFDSLTNKARHSLKQLQHEIEVTKRDAQNLAQLDLQKAFSGATPTHEAAGPGDTHDPRIGRHRHRRHRDGTSNVRVTYNFSGPVNDIPGVRRAQRDAQRRGQLTGAGAI